MVMPAEGPSFGIAPAGTWMWMSLVLNRSGSMPYFVALPRTHVSAACTDSCITGPSWPVMMRPLLAARHASRFDEQHVAAHRRPGQAHGYARAPRALGHLLIGAEARRAQIGFHESAASLPPSRACPRRCAAPACGRWCRFRAPGCGRRLRACSAAPGNAPLRR